MTTMTSAGEGGGGNNTTGSGVSNTEQVPNPPTPSTPPTTQQQHPPPSPLSGCYLLVVLPEPHTAQHKTLILNQLSKGFLSWDKDICHVDLEKELQALVAHSPEGEEARNGERLIQYATENLVTEVLIYPQSNTLLQCIRNLLASFTKHRHIIHAGYTFGGNGSWILQDGTFSLADFLDAFSEHEVQRVLRAYENSVTVDIHCAGVGDWSTLRLSKEPCTRACRVRVNPDDVLTAGAPTITIFTNYIGQFLVPQTLDQLMEPSDVVGNIRFSHPTLYVFPGGEGDAALFGINGFNMLVDGGFARKACFWDFTRHLDRLDAVLVTRINNSNICGMSSILEKKKEMHVYPQIGHFFCNLIERKHSNSPDGDKDINPLILNLIDIGQEMMINLRHINLRPHPCYRDPEPINLYHKVGHGTLDMYVLSPNKDSREVREFMSKWSTSDSKLFGGSHKKDSNSIIFPVQNLVSICALLVWQPANPEDTITRILFPGSTPQHKIFEGFERLRHLEFLKHTVCTAKSLSPSSSLVTLKDKAAILKPKLGSIERETKRLAETRKEKKDISEVKAVKKDLVIDDAITKNSVGKPIMVPQPKIETKAKKIVENKKIESEVKEIKKIEKELKDTKKEIKKVEKSERSELETKKTDMKVETEKTALQKENKVQKSETKKKEIKETVKSIVKTSKPESVIRSSVKSIDKKSKPSGEKKDIMKSSPTTPKKSMNGTATKTEISKTVAKTTNKITSKSSTAPPAKSTKDANNRMVIERKNKELSSMAGSTSSNAGTKGTSKPKPIERKPVPRRTKPMSPSKGRLPISPAKSTKSTPTVSLKSEKDAVIRRVKAESKDLSALSTPTGIELESTVKSIDKNLTEKSEDISLDSIESKVLADLKDERQVVEEIEAVLQKAERIEEARKEDRFDGDDDVTAEVTDKKEEDVTEEDVTAEMDDMPKKILRKESQELTEEDEYLIVEKEEIFTENSVQSGDAEHKHHLDELESEKSRLIARKNSQAGVFKQDEEKEVIEEDKDEIPEKNLADSFKKREVKKSVELPVEDREILREEMQQIITSAAEVIQKTEVKEISIKKDNEGTAKETLSSNLDKLDSTSKPGIEPKELMPEKLEESQERISTLESGATTTAPTLPEDERIPLDDIKEDVDEKQFIEEIKEKDIPVQQEEILIETAPIITKPEIKVLDVQPPSHHNIPRDVVKTPDEVADLPVHEEVDPKLYKMDEIEKEKSAKVSPIQQQSNDPQISPPVIKEQNKGMFSFFGKVADKFEKGIDKLTKKTRRDSDKDAEDKSSKSSSPKEIKSSEKEAFTNIDIEKVFPKIGKIEEKLESSKKEEYDVSDIKPVIINETATFLQGEISSFENDYVQPATSDNVKINEDDIINDERLKEQIKKQVTEDNEDVEAFVEEASQKFKNVKDSLQDSLESLEDKIDEKYKLAGSSKDIIKDTLSEVAEKLVDSKPDINEFIESKEPEKVKFIIPSASDDFDEDEDDNDVIVRDFKEAVRDVAGVLVGTAGIEIEKEEQPKNVEEIIKRVAEVLKEDDFLSDKRLLTNDRKSSITDNSSEWVIEDIIRKRVSITEECPPHEDVEETLIKKPSLHYEKDEKAEVIEEPCISVIKTDVFKTEEEIIADKEDAKKLCEELLKDDIIKDSKVLVESDTRIDVMDSGLEKVCIKKIAMQDIYDENAEEQKIIIEPEINFEQNLSPNKAELVTITSDSSPSSPKPAVESDLPELEAEYLDIINKDTNLENIIEEFIVIKKQKITMPILEYIANIKCVPKEKIIHIIQEMIIEYKIPHENVTDYIEILNTTHNIPSEKRLDVEYYIIKEFLDEQKKISLSVIENISKKYQISKSDVIKIVEDVIINKNFSRQSVFDIPQESYFSILKNDLIKQFEREDGKETSFLDPTTSLDLNDSQMHFEKTGKRESLSSNVEESVEDKMVDGFVNISSTDAVEAFLQEQRNLSQTPTKVLNDFEAVEQEYKVHGIPSISSTKILDEKKEKEVVDSFDDFTDVIEADEKFVKETVEKMVHGVDDAITEIDKVDKKSIHEFDTSELSDIDTKEKYLDEGKEKLSHTQKLVDDDTQSLTLKSVDLVESRLSEKDEIKIKTEKLDNIPDEFVFDKLETNTTEVSDNYEKKFSIIDLELQQSNQDIPDERVKRMVVTASSEDGGHEIEICPSGSITFSKTCTPRESVKDIDVDSTLRKDSLIDKDIHKDSILSDDNISEQNIVSDTFDEEKKIQLPELESDIMDINKSENKERTILPDERRKSSIISIEEKETDAKDSDLSKQISDKGFSDDLKETNQSIINISENVDKVVIFEKSSPSDDLRQEITKTDIHQAEENVILPISTDDVNINKDSRKDSIISTDEFVQEHVVTSRDSLKSPGLEKEIYEISKTLDRKKSSIDSGNIVADVLDESDSFSTNKEIDNKYKSSDKAIFSEDVTCILDKTLEDSNNEKFKKQSLGYEKESKEASPEKEIEKDLIKKDILNNFEIEADNKEFLTEKLDSYEPINTLTEKAFNTENLFSDNEILKSTEEIKSPKIQKEVEKEELSLFKEAEIPKDEVIVEKTVVEKKEIYEEPFVVDKKVIETENICKVDNVIKDQSTDKFEAQSSQKKVISETEVKESTIYEKKEINDEDKQSIKEILHKKSIVDMDTELLDNAFINRSTDRSESLSAEKEECYKDVISEKLIDTDDAKDETHMLLTPYAEDKEKSLTSKDDFTRNKIPEDIISFKDEVYMPDKSTVITKDNISPEKTIIEKDIHQVLDESGHNGIDSRSKSSSVETHKIYDESSEKPIEIDNVTYKADTSYTSQMEEKSKSPSPEKNISVEKSSPVKSVSSQENLQLKDEVINNEALIKETIPEELIKIGDKMKTTFDQYEYSYEESIEKIPILEKEIEKEDELYIYKDIKHGDQQSLVDKLDHKIKSPNYESQRDQKDLFDDKLSTHIIKDSKEDDSIFVNLNEDEVNAEIICTSKNITTNLASPEDVDDITAQFSPSNADNKKLSITSSSLLDPTDIIKSDNIHDDKLNEPSVSKISELNLVDDKLYSDVLDDLLIDEKLQVDKSKEKSSINSRSSSISENKLCIETKLETSKSPHSIENQDILKYDFDERKLSETSNVSDAENKDKNRSRSHSLFETGDKSPLIRSRTASLYEDKTVEKLSMEHAKDSVEHINVAFQEKDEIQLSQDDLNDFQKHMIKRNSVDPEYEKEDADKSKLPSTEIFSEDSESQKMILTDKNLIDTIRTLKNISPNSEPESLITSESNRPEPYIDEEITISENKRIEVEALLMDDYITRGIRINEPILNEMLIKTSLPKYIIREIIEEIVIKRHIPMNLIIDPSIFVEDDYDDAQVQSDSERKTTPELSERKSSGYSTPDSQHYEEKNIDYGDYETPFHKAFMGGMTEIRTTHITTQSDKSTPEFEFRERAFESTSEIMDAKEATIKSVPEKWEESSNDEFIDNHLVSNKSKIKADDEMENPLKSDNEYQDQTHRNVSAESNFKFSGTTKHLDDSTDIHEEYMKQESIIEKILPEKNLSEKEVLEKRESIKKEESETVYEEVKHKIIKEIEVPLISKLESIHDDDINQKNIEIITKTTKTIITKKELDSVSRINTLSTDNISFEKLINSELQDDLTALKSTASSSIKPIDEKLISLEPQDIDQSNSSNFDILNKDIKTILDSDKSISYIEKEHIAFTAKDLMDHTVPEQLEQSASPLIRDLISEEQTKSAIDSSDHDSLTKSSMDSTISSLIREGSTIQAHFSGRSTPDKKSEGRSRTATPEGFRSGDVIRTIVTTTRTMSDDGEIITTTQEVTEATNDKGETIVLNEKTDVKVDDKLPENLIQDVKPMDTERKSSISSDLFGTIKENLSSEDYKQGMKVLESSDKQEKTIKISDDFSSATMTSSYYTGHPTESTEFSHFTTETKDYAPEQDEFSFKKFTVEKEYAGDYKDKGSKKYIDEADLDFEKALGERIEKEFQKEDKESSVLRASSSTIDDSTSIQDTNSESASKKDPIADWGSPLGLPSPKAPRKFNFRSPIQPCSSADLSPDSLNFDAINDWGEPMKLPTPAPAGNEISNKTTLGTPKKEKKPTEKKKVISENIKNRKHSESPIKIEKKIKDTKNKIQPVYVDLTYVSHHGNSFYTALEFFKKIRARYYVFSGTEPSREVYDALLEAKKSWEDKDLEVTMIPTYDTDTLGYWVADNEEALAAYHIDLSPSASRCTINLQDHETSCSAYRLEF